MAKDIQLSRNQIDLAQMLRQIKMKVASDINCHNVGKIIEFDKNTQTCTVEIMQLSQYNGETFPLAPITQVPLVIYGAGNGHITLPDPVGTYCILLFFDRNLDNFLETGEQYEPETTRMHDYTDCMAITTFKTLANPINDYDEKAVSILNEEIIEDVTYSSSAKIYGNKIDLSSATITSTSTQGGKVSIGATVQISNSSQNLNTLIQSFITACENIETVSGGTLTPASKTAFTDLKSQFEGLLL